MIAEWARSLPAAVTVCDREGVILEMNDASAGIKKMIYQAPWYQGGRVGGLVEIAFELPAAVPHFIRD
jgi:hypothetical protein